MHPPELRSLDAIHLATAQQLDHELTAFIPQCDERIQICRPACWQVAGEPAGRQQRPRPSSLFAVSSADQTIALIEDNEIRRVSRELRIEHADYIAARLAHRQHLGELKRDEQ